MNTSSYTLRPLTRGNAHTLLDWHYPPPYEFYNADPAATDDDIAELLDPDLQYHAIVDQQNDLIAFCCYGTDARVPGGDYRLPAVDVGWGLRPDLTGRGLGVGIVAAILAHGRFLYAPPAFRATVATWNVRSRRVCERSGFVVVQHFTHPAPWSDQGREWVLLVRDEAGTL